MSPRTCQVVTGSAVPVTERGPAPTPAGPLDSRPGLVARYRRAIDALTRCRTLLRQSQGDLATERADRQAAEDLCRALAADNQALRDRLASTEAERDAARAEATAEHAGRLEAEELASYDAHTGLLNRHGLIANWSDPGAVLVLDLNRFKRLNDTLGHEVVNGIVVVLAGRMARCGVAARLTRGDEFAVLVPDAAKALGFAGWLGGVISAPIELPSGRIVVVTASIGVALADGHAGPDELLERADLAMYHAKYHRRSPVVWTPGMGMPEPASIGARGAA